MNNVTYPSWLLDYYREACTDFFDEHVEIIIDDLIDRLRDHGISLNVEGPSVHASVNWSLHTQGAGACFSGYVEDWPKFLSAHGYTCEDYPMFWKLVTLPEFEHDVGYGTVTVNRFYTHENTAVGEWAVESAADFSLYTSPENAEAFAEIIDEMTHQLGREMDVLEKHFITDFRDHMRWLHKQIEDEWDYVTSDEYVSEWISDNVTDDEIREQIEAREAA